MKIVTLVENVVYKSGLSAEHGLSLYIEHGGHRILFDTGQSDRFLRNAEALGIDIASVEALVISHGHYDHAGGLEAFCRANSSAKIYVKEGFFDPKYNKDEKFIGIPYQRALFEGRLQKANSAREIFPGVHILTEIPLVHEWDTHFTNLFVRRGGDLELDQFSDEQFLVFAEGEALVVISGCSHRGITNILSAAAEAFPFGAARGEVAGPAVGKTASEAGTDFVSTRLDKTEARRRPLFKLVLGGFHLSGADVATADRMIHTLDEFNIERLGCCHCTGVEHYARIKATFGERAFYGWTGTELEL